MAGLAEQPPGLTAGTGEDGAKLCHLSAGGRVIGAFGCGKSAVGSRHTAISGKQGNCRRQMATAHPNMMRFGHEWVMDASGGGHL